jgi:hypothetical protein
VWLYPRYSEEITIEIQENMRQTTRIRNGHCKNTGQMHIDVLILSVGDADGD